MMKKNLCKYGMVSLLLIHTTVGLTAQEPRKEVVAVDTTDVVVVEEQPTSDRNVMLNAANNTGPRDVNIGLPASVGGTTILENGLPVVYFFWPEMPTKAWRQDAAINRVNLYDLGQTALKIGDVGFSVDTYNNLGTSLFQGNGNFNSNHFGLIRNDFNLSGPVGVNGWKYTVGAYISFNPGTYTPEDMTRFYSDQTQLYKIGVTKDYRYRTGTGSVTALYKFMDSRGMIQEYSPFIYDKDGKVKELDGFKIGRKSYFERSGKLMLKDAFTNEYVNRDVIDDYGSNSHTIDVIGNNNFNNGLNLNYIVRYHAAKSGNFLPIMTGVSQAAAGQFVYEDGTLYSGENVQNVLIIASKRTPIKSLTGTFELGKKSGSHNWKVGLNQWVYNIDKFASESVMYVQEVAPDPRKLIEIGGNADRYGNVPAGFEYHNGTENKTALYFTDNWDISSLFSFNYGVRLEYQSLRGDYQDASLALPDLNGPKTKIKKDFLNKVAAVNGVYKATARFGVLGEANYNEQSGHLENYSIGQDPDLKKSKILGAGLGVFYNHSWFSLVSKATYIQRDQYRTTVNFSNPQNYDQVERVITKYDIQTIGWTTDIMANPFKNFDLHFLFTFQSPKYKNYSGDVDFGNGVVSSYNFSDKIVTGVSKVLLEIDPSYTWKDLRVWASARYFSKQYFNKPNTLELAGRWETFAGASYKLNDHIDLSCTIVNLLNQRGANGSLPDADLILTDEQAATKVGQIMSGTYIRPFTVEFGVKYKF